MCTKQLNTSPSNINSAPDRIIPLSPFFFYCWLLPNSTDASAVDSTVHSFNFTFPLPLHLFYLYISFTFTFIFYVSNFSLVHALCLFQRFIITFQWVTIQGDSHSSKEPLRAANHFSKKSYELSTIKLGKHKWITTPLIYHTTGLPVLWVTIQLDYHSCELPYIWVTTSISYHTRWLPFLWVTIKVDWHFSE